MRDHSKLNVKNLNLKIYLNHILLKRGFHYAFWVRSFLLFLNIYCIIWVTLNRSLWWYLLYLSPLLTTVLKFVLSHIKMSILFLCALCFYSVALISVFLINWDSKIVFSWILDSWKFLGVYRVRAEQDHQLSVCCFRKGHWMLLPRNDSDS